MFKQQSSALIANNKSKSGASLTFCNNAKNLKGLSVSCFNYMQQHSKDYIFGEQTILILAFCKHNSLPTMKNVRLRTYVQLHATIKTIERVTPEQNLH
jgi:hypothetical protein